MNNIVKAFELNIAETTAAMPPAPVDRFRAELAALRQSIEREAPWRQKVMAIKDVLAGFFSKSLSELAEEFILPTFKHADASTLVPKCASTPVAIVVDKEPSIDTIRAIVIAGPRPQNVDVEVLAGPEIWEGDILSLRLRLPAEIIPNVHQWKIALFARSRLEVVGEPQDVLPGPNERVKFDLPAELAKEWRNLLHQNLEIHRLPFGLLLDVSPRVENA